MAQNSSGTANSVNPQSGEPATDPPGVGKPQGSADSLSADTTAFTQTHIEFRFGATFNTQTMRIGNC